VLPHRNVEPALVHQSLGEGRGTLTSGGLVSPAGGLVIPLSTSGFAMVAAATAQRQYLLHVVPEQEPYLLGERHIDMEIGQKCTGIGAMVMVMHGSSFSLKSFPPQYSSRIKPIREDIFLNRYSKVSSLDGLTEVSAVKRPLSREQEPMRRRPPALGNIVS